MTAIISNFVSVFIFLPILLFIILVAILLFANKKRHRAFQIAADITTLFFIFSVYFLVLTIWSVSIFLLLILSMILFLLVFASIYLRVKGKIDYIKVFRGFWRLMFIIFFLLYISLMGYGILSSAFSLLG